MLYRRIGQTVDIGHGFVGNFTVDDIQSLVQSLVFLASLLPTFIGQGHRIA